MDKRIQKIVELVFKLNQNGRNLILNLNQICLNVVDVDLGCKNLMCDKVDGIYTTIYFKEWYSDHYDQAVNYLLEELTHLFKMTTY